MKKSKKLAIIQSNYIPWKGYFDMIGLVDEFVLYDDAQYTKRDWRNRNLIKTATGLQWLTIPVLVKGKFEQYFRPVRIVENTTASLFGFPIICRDTKLRNELQIFLEQNGVETRPIVCGNMTRQPAFKHYKYKVYGNNLPGADEIMDKGLYWGNNPLMTDEEISYLVQTIKKFFRK